MMTEKEDLVYHYRKCMSYSDTAYLTIEKFMIHKMYVSETPLKKAIPAFLRGQLGHRTNTPRFPK